MPREMQATTAWGSKQIGTPVWEHATVVPETGAVLVWLWHA